MRKILIPAALAAATALWLAPVYGEMMEPGRDMMHEYSRAEKGDQESLEDFQRSMFLRMMEKYGPGLEMMGGYGMSPEMMSSYGKGQTYGCGMGPGMMHRYGMKYGCGRGPGMMGTYGYCQRPTHMWNYGSDEWNAFMNETRETRKKLHDLHFEYGEMMRNPKTTVEELRNMEKEMDELRQELRRKAAEK